jgi:hypothetical protein
MEHIYHIDDDVLHQFQGPQGREVVEASHVYTILALLPVEADRRPRYRIKSKDEISGRLWPRTCWAVPARPAASQCNTESIFLECSRRR